MMKTRSLVSGLLVLTGVMLFTACHGLKKKLIQSDDRQTEMRQLRGFEKIEINGSPTVYYTQADSFSVTVEGTAKGVDRILTEVDRGTLRIRNRGKLGVINVVTDDDDKTIVRVSSPDLVELTLNGSGDFISQRRIDTDEMRIVLRGSGDIDVNDLICDNCQVELIGSGHIDLDRVETREASAVLVGSGDLDIHLCNTATTRLSLKGSGDIDAEFSQDCKNVECELHGSGDITLEGEVRHLAKQQSGSGDVNVGKLAIRP